MVAIDSSTFPKSPTPSLLISPRTSRQSWNLPRPTLRTPFTTKTLCSTLPLVSSDVSTMVSADSLDVYALEVAGGGDACIGHIGHSHSDDAHSHAASSTAVAPATSSAAAAPAASTTAAPAASATSAAADIPAPPAESTGCVLHNDHYDCEGPAAATSAAAAAEQTGDCHTHADGGKPKIP
jgi:hypothetical protein